MRFLKPFPNPTALLKTHFLSGMLVLIPFGVIAWILGAVLAAIWRLHGLLPKSWVEDIFADSPAMYTLINVAFTIGALAFAAFAVSTLGWASKNFFGRKILEFFGELISHIPVLRSVYSALDQLLKTIAAGGGQQFSRVVYVEFPRKNCWTLAFVTSPGRIPGMTEKLLNLFVPATPNPTSGFYLIVPETEVRESHLKVEEAFKIILSLGIAQSPIPGQLDGGR